MGRLDGRAIVWTRALADACELVARDPAEVEYRNMADVRSRAGEFVRYQRVGYAMSQMNVEYFVCLFQRLETSDRYGLDSHRALVAAWDEAWLNSVVGPVGD